MRHITWLLVLQTEYGSPNSDQLCVTEEQKPTRCHLLFYCTSYRLNMFQALLCPSPGARDYNVDYHIGRFVRGLL